MCAFVRCLLYLSCWICLFDLLLVGRASYLSHLSVYIYNNPNDVSVNSVHCHAYVAASRLSSNANVCACIRYSFIPRCFSEKIPFNGIHTLLLMKWTRGIGHVLLLSASNGAISQGISVPIGVRFLFDPCSALLRLTRPRSALMPRPAGEAGHSWAVLATQSIEVSEAAMFIHRIPAWWQCQSF